MWARELEAPDGSRIPARDARIPAARKGLLGVALGYLVLGRDLVPDEVPFIGGLDDLVVVVLAVDLFLDGVPDTILFETLDRHADPNAAAALQELLGDRAVDGRHGDAEQVAAFHEVRDLCVFATEAPQAKAG